VGKATLARTPAALQPGIQKNFPGIQAARFTKSSLAIKKEAQLIPELMAFIDPEFLEIFSYPSLLYENAAFQARDEVILTTELARRLFGKENPIGEFITILFPDQTEKTFFVGDVLRPFPENTSFHFSMLLHIDYYLDSQSIDSPWSEWIDGTFVKLSVNDEPGDVSGWLQKFVAIQNAKNPSIEIDQYRLNPISNWPAEESSQQGSRFMGHLHPASVAGTVGSSIAVLLLAIFNFINTSISLSAKRLKEIGVRKILGGDRSMIIRQFMIENFLLIASSLLLSLLISHFLIPAYNAMFEFQLVNTQFVGLIPLCLLGIGLLVITGLIAGTYPAFYISRFEALQIIKNRVKFSSKNYLIKSLILIQFVFCFYNVFALLIFIENSQYQEALDRGYELGETINIPLQTAGQYDVLRDELLRNPSIRKVTPTQDLVGYHVQDINLEYHNEQLQVAGLFVGHGYLKSLQTELIKGSYFPAESGDQRYILINELLEKTLGRDLLYDQLIIDGIQYSVIGVVRDFNLRNIMLSNKIRPAVFMKSSHDNWRYAVVQKSTGNLSELDYQLEHTWYSLFPDQLYRGFYQEDIMRSMRKTNTIMIYINTFIAVVSLLISALGLYTLVALTAQRRIKEFGIRKVMGASPGQILLLLNRDIILILSFAAVIGLYVGHLIISQLLDIIYAYHQDIRLAHFLWPLTVIVAIVGISIGLKVINTAKVDPVQQLRME
ncbi:MAG: FtsX-like permease family protein, partial [Cyclobacteriaceae bacterium]|nr:FtsX-like permease family protein [Cyclobacteriaceae bacterium HetDA_MAG_MS6]